jgi:predicted DNA-binding antitoxin AbrB/MazE fold protein
MKLVEARYEKGSLKPTKPLALRPGELVDLIVVRRPDPDRWNLDRFRKATSDEDLELAERGLSWDATFEFWNNPEDAIYDEY